MDKHIENELQSNKNYEYPPIFTGAENENIRPILQCAKMLHEAETAVWKRVCGEYYAIKEENKKCIIH